MGHILQVNILFPMPRYTSERYIRYGKPFFFPICRSLVHFFGITKSGLFHCATEVYFDFVSESEEFVSSWAFHKAVIDPLYTLYENMSWTIG